MKEHKGLLCKDEAKELMDVLLERKPPDLAIINARLVNVYTGEVLDNSVITTKGKWIAYVGPNLKGGLSSKTKVIDAAGKTVIPGFIDGHTHLVPFFAAHEFVKQAIKRGTTTVIAETMELYPIGRVSAVLDFIASYSNQPLKVYFTAPAMVSISRHLNGIPKDDLKNLLLRGDILGLGESYWQAVLQEPDKFFPLFEETLKAGKILDGHAAGAGGRKLMAYLTCGISSCHEPINAEEVLERLRLGLFVMVREGSIRRELEAVSSIKDMAVDLRRMILVSDGIDPKDILELGYMDHVVQKAIDFGFPPVKAIQMATLNVAERFSLHQFLGGIAPGKYADLLMIPDPHTIEVDTVISQGEIVVENGELKILPRKPSYAKESYATIRLPRPFLPDDFVIRVKGKGKKVTVRVIDQVTDLVTKEWQTEMPVVGGKIEVDIRRDIIKAVAVDRIHRPGKFFVGLLHGFRMERGAFATSAAWDTSDIIAVGVDDGDLALAINRLKDIGGGIIVCAERKILAEFPLPLWGLVSFLPMEELKSRMEEVIKVAHGLGIPFSNPFLSLVTLTGAAIPYFRICEEGLFHLKEGKTYDLIVT